MTGFPDLSCEICWSAGVQEYEGSDSFTRTDSAVTAGTATSGQEWQPFAGVFGIASNKLYLVSGAPGVAGIRSLANGDHRITLSTVQNGSGAAFCIRDGSNFYSVRANTGTGKYDLYKTVAGVDTLLASSTAASVADGVVLTVRREAADITVYVDGVSKLATTDATFTTGLYSGVYASGTSARFDDFSALYVKTDVSQYVKDYDFSRGRTYELDAFETGILNLTLSGFDAAGQPDRRFEPQYDGSPYWFDKIAGKQVAGVIPMRRVWLTETWSAVDYAEFAGFIEGWPLAWNQRQTDGQVNVTAVDPFDTITYRITPDYSETIQELDPRAYYRMGGDPEAVADIGPNGYDPLTLSFGTASLVTPGLLPALAGDDGCMRVASSGQWSIPSEARLSGTGDFTICGVLKPSLNDQSFIAPASNCELRLNANKFRGVTGASTLDSTTTAVAGSVYHVAFRRTGLVLDLFVDGVLESTSTLGAVVVLSASAGLVGGGNATTTYDEVFWCDSALTDGEILNLANISGRGPNGAAVTLPAGQTTGERVEAICDLCGIGPLMRDIDPGTVTCAADLLLAQNPRDMLEQVRQTEGISAALYFDGAGKLCFRDAHYTRDQAPADVWGDQTGDLHYEEISEPSLDRDRVVNLVTVTTTDGTAVVLGDTVSQQQYQRRPVTFDTVHDQVANMRSAARWALIVNSEAQLRVDEMSFDFGADEDADPWARLLPRELSDRVTIRCEPPGGGDLIVRDVVVEKLHQTRTTRGISVAFGLAPEPTYTRGWMVGVAGRSEVGSTTWVVPA